MDEKTPVALNEEEFVFRAIKRLRKPPYKGIHSVFSGFNQAFKEQFGKNPIEVTNRMAQEGKIMTRPVRGGVMLYLPTEAPVSPQKGAASPSQLWTRNPWRNPRTAGESSASANFCARAKHCAP